jgi:hypothetical protein
MRPFKKSVATRMPELQGHHQSQNGFLKDLWSFFDQKTHKMIQQSIRCETACKNMLTVVLPSGDQSLSDVPDLEHGRRLDVIPILLGERIYGLFAFPLLTL